MSNVPVFDTDLVSNENDQYLFTLNIWVKPLEFQSIMYPFLTWGQYVTLNTENMILTMQSVLGFTPNPNLNFDLIYKTWQRICIVKYQFSLSMYYQWLNDFRYINNQIIYTKTPIDWTISFNRDMNHQTYHIGTSASIYFLLRDFVFYNRALTNNEIKMIAYQVGDIQLYKSSMIRYYKLTLFEEGNYIFDYSYYEKHSRMNEATSDLSYYVYDEDMDSQISFAALSKVQLPDQLTFCEDDFNTNFRKILVPLWPKTYSVFNIEFWFKFSDIISRSYEFYFLTDSYDINNFSIRTVAVFQFVGPEILFGNIYSSTPPASTFTYYMKELRIWNIFRTKQTINSQLRTQFKALFKTSYFRKMSTYPGGGLLGYWQLQKQDSFGDNYLSDDSINPQTIELIEPLKYCSYTPALILCNFGQTYDSIKNLCKDDTSTQQLLLNVNTGSSQKAKFWFLTSIQNGQLIKREDARFNVIIKTPSPGNTAFYLERLDTFPSTFFASRVNYIGTFKEVRVWAISDDYFHFYKRDIVTPTATSALLDYWRLDGDSQDDIFTHWNYPTSIFLETDYVAPSIPTSLYDKLYECKHGSYFSGTQCVYDNFIIIKSGNNKSPLLMKVNQTTTPQSYSVGFWFKLRSLQDQNIICGATPRQNNFLYLRTTTSVSDKTLELNQANCQFLLTRGYDVQLTANRWFQISTSVKNVNSLTSRLHFAALTDYTSKNFITKLEEMNCPSFSYVNNEPDAEVYLCDDSIYGNEGNSIKNLYFLNDYAMTANDVFTASKVAWKMLNLKPALYLIFNNTQKSVWAYDLANKHNIISLRGQITDSPFYWVHDSFAPKICHDYYEVLDLARMICFPRLAMQHRPSNVVIENVALAATWTPTYQLSFGMFIKSFYGGTGMTQHIMTVNPTGSSNNQKLVLQTTYFISSGKDSQDMSFELENLPLVQYEYQNRIDYWQHLAFVRDSSYYIYESGLLRTETPTAAVSIDVNYDGLIYIGQMPGTTTPIGFRGYIRQFKIYETALTSSQIMNYMYDSYKSLDTFDWAYYEETNIYFGSSSAYTGLTLGPSPEWSLSFMFNLGTDLTANKVIFAVSNWLSITRHTNNSFLFIYQPQNAQIYTMMTPEFTEDQWYTFAVTYPANLVLMVDNLMIINQNRYYNTGGYAMPAITGDITYSGTFYLREIRIWKSRLTESFLRQNSTFLKAKSKLTIINEYLLLVKEFPLAINNNNNIDFSGNTMVIELYDTNQGLGESILTSISRQAMISNGKGLWIKFITRFFNSDLKMSISAGDQVFDYELSLFIGSIDYTQLKYIRICPNQCDMTMAFLTIWKAHQDFTNEHDYYKKPYPHLVYGFWPMTEGTGETLYDYSIYQLSRKISRLNSYGSKFKWWSIKEINNEAEVLVMCNQETIYNFKIGFCVSYISYQTQFHQYSGLDVTKLKNNPEVTYNRDWAIELWLNFQFEGDLSQIDMPIIKSDPDCIADQWSTSYEMSISRDLYQMKNYVNFQSQNYQGTSGIIKEYRNVLESSWFHVTVVNIFNQVQNSQAIYVNVKQPLTDATSFARYKLSNCDIFVGHSSTQTIAENTFSIKQLRIWNEVRPQAQIAWHSLQRSFDKGELNLMKYYKFNREEGLQETISNSQYAVGANVRFKIFIDKFHMDCPNSYHYSLSKGRCEHYSFSLIMCTYTSAAGDQDFLAINDFLIIRVNSRKYSLELKTNDPTRPSLQITIDYINQGTAYWGFHFDAESSLFWVSLQGDIKWSVQLQTHQFKLDGQWTNQFGYNGINLSGTIGIMKQMIFSPALTKQEVQKYYRYGYHPTRASANALSAILFDKNDLYSGRYNLVPYQVSSSSEVDTFQVTNGSPFQVSQTNSCREGAFRSSGNGECTEPFSLVVNNQILSLPINGMKIGYSATVQFWVNLFSIGSDLTYQIELFDVKNLVGLSLENGQLYFKQYIGAVTPSTQITSQFTRAVWQKFHFVLYKKQWTIYENGQQFEASIPNDQNYENVVFTSIDFDLRQGSMYKAKLQEVAIFGYPRSPADILNNLHSQINKKMYQNSLLVYYPLDESYETKVYDYSRYGRSLTITNPMIYWDNTPRGNQGANLLSSTGSDYQTRENSLYFKYGETSSLTFPESVGLIGQDYSIMYCYNIRSLTDLPFTEIPMLEIMDIMAIYLLRVDNTNLKLRFYPSLQNPITSGTPECNDVVSNKWMCVVASLDTTQKLALMIIPRASKKGIIYSDNEMPILSAQRRVVKIHPTNAYIREVKIFNIAISEGNLAWMVRQAFNPLLYWGNYLVFYYRLDESNGGILFDQQTTDQFSILASQATLSPQWSYAGSKLIICEGDAKYSYFDYCQPNAKFFLLEQRTPLFQVNLFYAPQKNYTTVLWLMINQLDQSNGFLIYYHNRYYLRITTSRRLVYSLGNYPSQSVDVSSIAVSGKWFMLFQMANTDANYSAVYICYRELGAAGFKNKQIKINKPWIYSDPTTNTNLYLQFQMGANTKSFIRDLQVWSAPLSYNYFMSSRVYLGLDPVKMRAKGLQAYFRFDESGGQYVFNYALPEVYNRVSSYYYHSALRWYYYADLNVDLQTNSEEMVKFLFCNDPYSRLLNKHCDFYDSCDSSSLTDDCTGPESTDLPTCDSSLTQFYSPDTRDCYDCHSLCLGCTEAYRQDKCLSCQPGLFLLDGLCTFQCPDNYYNINGICKTCTDNLCKCLENNLDLCLDCLSSSHFYLEDIQKCLAVLPDFKFYDYITKSLLDCHPMCKKCFQDDQYSCLQCADNATFLAPNYCNIFSCMTGNEIRQNANGEAICVPCQAPCLTCQNQPDFCTSCGNDLILDSEGQCLPCSALVGYQFPIVQQDGKKICTEICGDGLRLDQNQCDDANLEDGDGCSSKCQVENKYVCKGGSSASKDICHDLIGPEAEIMSVSTQSKYIILQIRDNNGKVYTDQQNISRTDIELTITGIDGAIRYSITSQISDDFVRNGKIYLEFQPGFSIPDEGAFVQVNFKKSQMFFDQYKNPLKNIKTNVIQLKKFDYIDPSLLAAIKTVGSSVSQGTSLILAFNLILSFALDKALDSLYSAINSVQILFFLPLIDLAYPPFFNEVFRYLAYANFENQLLRDPLSASLDFDNIKDSPLNEVFYNYGFESQVFLSTFQYKLGILFIIFCFFPLSQLFKRFKHRYFNIFRKLDNFFKYNGVLRLGQELYLEMGLLAYLNIYNLQFENKDQIINTAVAIIAIIFVTFYPLITLNLVQTFKTIDSNFKTQTLGVLDGIDHFKLKIYALIEGTRIQANSRLPQFNFSLFLARRLSYIQILVFLTNFPQLQIVLCIFKTILQLAYFILVQPYESKLTNIMSILNESITGIAFSICFMFKKDLQTDYREFYGWLVIGCAIFILAANLIVAIIETIKSLVEGVRASINAMKRLVKMRQAISSKITQKFSGNGFNLMSQTAKTDLKVNHSNFQTQQMDSQEQINENQGFEIIKLSPLEPSMHSQQCQTNTKKGLNTESSFLSQNTLKISDNFVESQQDQSDFKQIDLRMRFNNHKNNLEVKDGIYQDTNKSKIFNEYEMLDQLQIKDNADEEQKSKVDLSQEDLQKENQNKLEDIYQDNPNQEEQLERHRKIRASKLKDVDDMIEIKRRTKHRRKY
ncbi:UNKNOWN [Stylonychia lemnae]|uniref:VSP domain containing protein n=1 Tax=Stylonychia lemnae TaxID=5949 RepID=A0A078AQL5_STYLE|nr:UNKNOWN [Stylonychia lemnae]|eukprot:CDW84474.1 UNKNOWN [Stylonychia lemnae]